MKEMTDEQKKQKEFLEVLRTMLDESDVKYILTFKFPEEKEGECLNGCLINANTPEMLRFTEMIEESVTEIFEKKLHQGV